MSHSRVEQKINVIHTFEKKAYVQFLNKGLSTRLLKDTHYFSVKIYKEILSKNI